MAFLFLDAGKRGREDVDALAKKHLVVVSMALSA